MKREITIFDIASTFLNMESMTHKKLQKLCYYAQAWYLALYNERLIDSKFEAWIHGPVSPELYDKYKDNGWTPIKNEETPQNIEQNQEIYEFIEEIYRIYGDLDGNDLEVLTHKELPWLSAREGLGMLEWSNNVIDENIMRDFYLEEFKNSQND
ncbi:Panacea domain-containing protein [Senegalia massiliensis]|uniref:Panacea domain-containing protein n=1 Tax=Senegalia massiliensis TaxID=1720316 RepID=UPI001030B6C6|nr:type II toxin-antitoxin system antitoxin SocA domain-containing protein [Senegalia massiliensis]